MFRRRLTRGGLWSNIDRNSLSTEYYGGRVMGITGMTERHVNDDQT